MKKLIFALPLLAIAACDVKDKNAASEADKAQAQATAQLATQAVRQVGMPSIRNFREMRRVRRLYELRDGAITTYTYLRNAMTGELTFLCESIGYGINASIQFSNPVRPLEVDVYGHPNAAVTIGQPEPNGLFMPEGLAATYVECATEKGEPAAVYVEDPIIVSPFRLKATASYQGQ